MKNNNFLFIRFQTLLLIFIVSYLLLAVSSEAQLMKVDKMLAVPLEDFQVNENAGSCSKWIGAIAIDNNSNFLIVWQDNRNFTSHIFAQRFDHEGQALGASFLVANGSTNQFAPDIAIDGNGNFVITWYNEWYGNIYNWHIHAKLYNKEGILLNDISSVNDDVTYPAWKNTVHTNPAIAIDKNGSFVITWEDYRSGAEIYAQRYNSNGDTLGTNFKVNDDTLAAGQCDPDVAINNNGNFVITWYDKRNGNYDIYAQLYDSDGNTIGVNFKVNDDLGDSRQDFPVVAMDRIGNFVIAWNDSRNGKNDIYAQYYNSLGQKVEVNFKVNDDVGSTTQYTAPAITMDGDGNFMITWKDCRNGDNDIYAQCYSFTGDIIGENFRVNDDSGNLIQQSPTAAANDQGEFIVAWNDERNGVWDIYTQRFDSIGQKIGENLKAIEEDGTSWQDTPAITADKVGNFVITWRDFRYDHKGDIYAQRYNLSGQAIENNFKINDDAEFSAQENSALIMDRQGNFIIVWQDKRNGNEDIYGQRFDNSGKPQDSNFRINDDLGNSGQYVPNIGIDDNGNFAVVWKDSRNGNYDIFCQRYTSKGAKLGSNFMVNEYAENSGQYEPTISMDSNGNFVIVWQDRRNGNLDIFGQRFDNRGTPQGTNFKINDDTTTSEQDLPDVSIDVYGNFSVVWRDKRTAQYDIYGQCYTNNGEKKGDNFKITDYSDTRDYTFYPAISIGDNGYFVVVWDDRRSGNTDIYYQFFDNEGNKIGMNYLVNNDPSGKDQSNPDVVMVNRFIYYTWTDNRVPGQGYDIFARINVLNYAPASPTLISPPNNSLFYSNIQTLTFTIPDDAENDSLHFKVEIAQDSSFINQIPGNPFESLKDTIGFSPIPPVAASSGHCSLRVISPLSDGKWWWRVSSSDNFGYGEVSESFNFTIDTTPPYTAEHNPTKGETNVPINTNIVVHVKDDISGVDSVTIKMKVNEQQVIHTITGSDTDYIVTYDPPNDFNYNDKITISIDAQDKAGNVMATDNYFFTTASKGNTAPEAPALISPANNSRTSNTTPTLTWSVPTDVDDDSLHFKLELDHDNDWNNISLIIESKDDASGFMNTLPVKQGSANFNYTLQSELTEGDWWWRVAAWDHKAYGSFSEIWKFTISKTPIDTITALPNPFTPNSDGFNDFVEFKYPEMKDQKPIVQIFNLKGKKVNELKDFSGDHYLWDGKDNSGRQLEPGVYIYILEVNGKRISNGTITLIR